MEDKKLTIEEENTFLKSQKDCDYIAITLAYGSLKQSSKLTKELMDQYKADSEKWYEARKLLRTINRFFFNKQDYCVLTEVEHELMETISELLDKDKNNCNFN